MTMSVSPTYRYMLANCAQLLENQPLCDFLKNMDNEEAKKMEKEEDRFVQEKERLRVEIVRINEAYSWKNILLDGVYAAAGLGIPSGLGRLAYEKSEWAKIKFTGAGGLYGWSCAEKDEAERVNDIGKNSIKQGVITGVISGLCIMGNDLITYWSKKGLAVKLSYINVKECILETNSDRILRLQNKIREIEKQMLQPQNAVEINQLSIAKDYFSLKKTEMEVDKTNKVKLAVKHYHYV